MYWFQAKISIYFLVNNFNVMTEIVAVDFNEGRPVYEIIQKALENKEIGILGKC